MTAELCLFFYSRIIPSRISTARDLADDAVDGSPALFDVDAQGRANDDRAEAGCRADRKGGLAILQCFNANCFCAAGNRLQDAV